MVKCLNIGKPVYRSISSGCTWSAVVRPVGCTAKFSETPLEMAYGIEVNFGHITHP